MAMFFITGYEAKALEPYPIYLPFVLFFVFFYLRYMIDLKVERNFFLYKQTMFD